MKKHEGPSQGSEWKRDGKGIWNHMMAFYVTLRLWNLGFRPDGVIERF